MFDEMWIHEDGSTTFADGNTGDYNHECIVMQRVIAEVKSLLEMSDDELCNAIAADLHDEYDCDSIAFEEDILNLWNQLPRSEECPWEWIKTHCDDPKGYVEALLTNEDIRVWAMIHLGWTAVRRNCVETYRIRNKKCRIIYAALQESYPGDELPPDDMGLWLEDRATGYVYHVELGDISGGLSAIAGKRSPDRFVPIC